MRGLKYVRLDVKIVWSPLVTWPQALCSRHTIDDEETMTDYVFNHMTDTQLSEISREWLFSANVRAAFERYLLMKALLPELEAAHEGVLAASSPVSTRFPNATALDEADGLHDKTSRGGFDILSGVYLLTGDAQIGALLDFLYPKGAAINRASYVDEAGEGARIAANMTDAHRALLRAVVLHDGSTLLDHVMARLVHAAELGRLVDGRAQTNAAPLAPRETTRAGARQRWISVARGLLQNLVIARVSDEDARLITAKVKLLQP